MRARLASGNPHKLVELRRALPGWEIELVAETEYPPEDGSTYEENARGKAEHGRSSSPADAWVIGEDSGIEAAALGWKPGIASARWAEDGVARMLRELDGVHDRRARYRCVIVALGPAGEEVVAEGALDGTIAYGSSGDEGFGYDPIFKPRGETRTVAQLGNEWKSAHSHRARAAASLAHALADRASAAALQRPQKVVGSSAMQAQDVLDELITLSSQLDEVALLGDSGTVLASSGPSEQAERLARVAADLLVAAADVRPSGVVSRVQIDLGTKSVFVVVEGGHTAVATTIAEPTAGLVVYDLRTALRRLAEAPSAAASTPKKKGKADA